MPAPPAVAGAELVDGLGRHGFVVVASAGAHCAVRGHGPGHVVIVPLHDDLAEGTLTAVLGKTGFTLDELPGLLS